MAKSKRKKVPPVVKWGKSIDCCVKSACGRFEIIPDDSYSLTRKESEGYILLDSGNDSDEKKEYRTQAMCKDAAAGIVKAGKLRAELEAKKAAEAKAAEKEPLGSSLPEPAIDLGILEKTAPAPKPVGDTRKVTSDGFEYIERVWAADGVVKVETKEGKLVNMTVRDAAVRASQINAMPLPHWHVERRNELVRQILNACKEAKRQMESPKDAKAAAMCNLLNGFTEDGRTLEQLRKSQPVLVQEAMKLQPSFVHLDVEEIVSILKEPQLGKEAKMRIMAEEDWSRSQDTLKPAPPDGASAV